jgi:hypothetical protein
MSTDPRNLSTLLREAPVPPTRITTGDALSLGRKAVRRRRHLMTTGAAVAVVAIAAAAGGLTFLRPAPAPTPLTLPSASPSPSPSPAHVDYTKWTPTTLPLPDGVTVARVRAMDSSGRYVVGSADNDHRAILWDGLTPHLLPLPTPALWVLAVDVNASGVVIGDSAGSSAWVYQDGITTKLFSPAGGGHYVVRDINDRGDILGWSQRASAILRPAGAWNGPPREVSNVEEPFALAEDGTVGGSNNQHDHAVVVSPDGRPRDLATAAGKPGGHIFHISGDWACGWVSGESKSYPIAARWRLSTGELTSFPTTKGNCTGLARSGAMLAFGEADYPRLLVTPDGTVINMPTGGKPGIPGLEAISADATAIAGNLIVTRPGAEPARTPTIWRRTS